MAKAEKFTYKKQPAGRGLVSVGNPHSTTEIKHNKKVVGHITGPNWQSPDNLWRVRLVVLDEKEHCIWKWVTLKKTFSTEPDARVFLNQHAAELVAMGLYHFDDEV